MSTKTSAVITSVGANNKVISKAITDINPAADNVAIKTLCQSLNSLTNNTFTGAQRIDKTDITTATTKPKLALTLTTYAQSFLNFANTPNYQEDNAPQLFTNTDLPAFTYSTEMTLRSEISLIFVMSIMKGIDGKVYFATAKGTTIEETDDTQTIKIYFEETETTAATTAQLVISYNAPPVLTIL